MAIDGSDLFLVYDVSESKNKSMTYDALATEIEGGITIPEVSVEGGDGITVTEGGDVYTVSADLAANKGLYFDNGQLAVSLGGGLEFDPSGAIQVDIDTLEFKGEVDLTDDATRPAAAAVGDMWVNNGGGTIANAWGDRLEADAAGDECAIGDLVVCKVAATSQTTGTYIRVKTGGVHAPELWVRDDASNSLSPAFSGDNITDIGNIKTKGQATIETAAGNLVLKSANSTYITPGGNVSIGKYEDGVSNLVLFRSGATSAQYQFFNADNTFAGRFSFKASTDPDGLTAGRTYTWQDKSGTVALLSDIVQGGGGTVTGIEEGLGIVVDDTTPEAPEVAAKFGPTGTAITTGVDQVMPYHLTLLDSI